MNHPSRDCASAIAKGVIAVTAVLFQLAFSANPAQVENSAIDLERSIKAAIGSNFLTYELPHYIPDYGMHLAFEKGSRIPELNTVTEQISTVLLEQGSTVKGLALGDWISVFFRGGGVENDYDLLIRMKQGEPDTLEVYVDGLPGDLPSNQN